LKTLIFTNELGMGGTGKAACLWARELVARGHQVRSLTLADGPRRAVMAAAGVAVKVVPAVPTEIAAALRDLAPEVIHAHAPGNPQEGDVLGAALSLLPQKIPVVQTNIFGRLNNPREDQWTDFRLFVSWTSCVQAARRSFRTLDKNFFRRASVAVNPLDPMESPPEAIVAAFRQTHGVARDEILFGRLSRPEPNKWTNLAVDAFRLALRRTRKIKLLLREPPPAVAAQLRAGPDARHFVILPATSDAEELRLTLSALDGVLHTSLVGESFGYGIAEPMTLGKPVITHSTPDWDQAQLELVRDGEDGFVASTPAALAAAIVRLAEDSPLRDLMGRRARQHIRVLANPATTTDRLEAILRAAIERQDSPFAGEDLVQARAVADYLDEHQFGHGLHEQLTLRKKYYRMRFHELRWKLRRPKSLTIE
jgi:glycosyltransferase involved in cell wall biosynthesis